MRQFRELANGTRFKWVSGIKMRGECVKVFVDPSHGVIMFHKPESPFGYWVHLKTGQIFEGEGPNVDSSQSEVIVL